jgi:hypothetical protein
MDNKNDKLVESCIGKTNSAENDCKQAAPKRKYMLATDGSNGNDEYRICWGCGRFGKIENTGKSLDDKSKCWQCNLHFKPANDSPQSHWTEFFEVENDSPPVIGDCYTESDREEFACDVEKIVNTIDEEDTDISNESPIYEFFLMIGKLCYNLDSDNNKKERFARTMEHRCRIAKIEKVNLLVANLFRVNSLLQKEGKREFAQKTLDNIAFFGSMWIAAEAKKREERGF